ncbi:MAG TPA: insulinase family protein [Bacteroidia bacterium]|nr:insulinase family protein [Bacteroidia bacterium]
MKNLLSLFGLLLFLFRADAQVDLKTPLPSDPKVRTGTLNNGMKYYIRQNSKPEKRAEFRLAVNAGSTSENDDQQGLAHLVEHMAFNGTKNFKKNELIDYLESVGTKFGAHLNAYTSFDETVYMIQLPTDSESIVNKGIQILEEWSHNLLFDSMEVEKERGVVVEEWRLGQGADERMRRKYWPILFKDSRYAERLPIGKKEIIEHCSQATLKSFYKDWYRPDIMAVIAVGDFDLNEMEAKLKKQFNDVPAVPNPRPVKAYTVPDNKEIQIAAVTDKEARFSMVDLFYKQPPQVSKTVEDYRRNIAQSLFSGMLNARMSELQRQADPPFMFSYSGYGDLVRNKYAYTSAAGCKENGIERALQTLVTENERVRRFGFTSTELERQKAEMMSGITEAYNEREKTESRNFAREYVSNFLTQEPMPGIEFEYSLYQQYLQGISLQEVNAFAGKWITDGENCVVLITAPDKETTKMPDDGKIRSIMKGMRQLELTPYVDKVVNKPLVENLTPAGTVVSTNTIEPFGITELKLSNGVRVALKPTDFKNDEILFTAYSWGGWSLYPEHDFYSAASSDEIVDQSGLGEFDATALEKLLTGKIVGCSPYVGELSQGFNGSCAPKDVETMMQLIYKYFTDPREDKQAFQSYIENRKGFLQNKNSDPQSIFRDTISYVMSGYNYRTRPMTVETLNEISLGRALEIYKERFSNASGFTFVFVGNFKVGDMKALCEKYLGSLPSKSSVETWKDLGMRPPQGKVEKVVKKGVEPKSSIVIRYTMPFEYTRQNRNEVNALMKLVSIRLREVLREDKSGVYGVGCNASPKHYPAEGLEVNISFGCSPANMEMLIKATEEVIAEVKEKDCDDKNLLKIKETALRERETGLKENQFWLNTINSNYQNNENLSEISTYTDWINKLTGSDLRKFAEKYLQTENMARFILSPEN